MRIENFTPLKILREAVNFATKRPVATTALIALGILGCAYGKKVKPFEGSMLNFYCPQVIERRSFVTKGDRVGYGYTLGESISVPNTEATRKILDEQHAYMQQKDLEPEERQQHLCDVVRKLEGTKPFKIVLDGEVINGANSSQPTLAQGALAAITSLFLAYVLT